MAKFIKVFYGSDLSETDKHELRVFANTRSEIYMEIKCDGYSDAFICLDIETAQAFCQEVVDEIIKLKFSDELNESEK